MIWLTTNRWSQFAVALSLSLGFLSQAPLAHGQARPNSSASEPITVRKEVFDCLVQDIRRLKQLKGRAPEIRVDVRTCALKVLSGNLGPEPEDVLVLDNAAISCIEKYRRRLSQIVIVAGDKYRIDLKRCAKPAR